MSNNQKDVMIEQYLDQLAVGLNNNFPNLISSEQLQRMKGMFLGTDKTYKETVESINNLVQQIVKTYSEKIKAKKEIKKEEVRVISNETNIAKTNTQIEVKPKQQVLQPKRKIERTKTLSASQGFINIVFMSLIASFIALIVFMFSVFTT